MSLKNTIEYYKQARFLHKQIFDVFEKFEAGEIDNIRQSVIITKTLDDINRLTNILSKINTHKLDGTYSEQTIIDVEHNIDYYYEGADYIEKYLLAKQYFRPLLNGINEIMKKISIPQYEYKEYASDENELARKFTAMLLHQDQIKQFLNQIKRLSIGTMSANEFKKIFYTNKNKMIRKPKSQGSFQSYKDYKEDYET